MKFHENLVGLQFLFSWFITPKNPPELISNFYLFQISDLSYAKRLDTVSGEGLCPADPNTSVTYTKTSPGK